jgi:hypothetical protein
VVLAGDPLILLVAVLAGLMAALARTWVQKSGLHVPDLKLIGVVPAAFFLQVLAFYTPGFARSLPNWIVSCALVASQLLLLAFAWMNRRLAGFWLLGVGLLLNMAVVLLNGGLMPISPETVMRLAPNAAPGSWIIGERFGSNKDVVLPEAQTILAFLSDRFILPNWFLKGSSGNAIAAFSIGDVVISLGAFWVLWSFGARADKSIF